jgi:hypothetical protein
MGCDDGEFLTGDGQEFALVPPSAVFILSWTGANLA